MSDPTEEWYAENPDLAGAYYYFTLYHGAYQNDFWVAVGRAVEYDPDTNQNSFKSPVIVSQSADGPWELIDAAADSGLSVPPYLFRIGYGAGDWVAIGEPGESGDNGVAIFTASNPTGPWAYNDSLVTATNELTSFSLAHDGATWATITLSGKLYTATDPAGTWSLERDFGSEIASSITTYARVEYVNETWVLAHSYLQSSTFTTRTFSASSPTGTWTSRGSFSGSEIRSIGYGPDGYFMVGYAGHVFTSPLTGTTWTDRINLLDEIPDGSQTGIYYDGIYDLRYDDGVYVALARRDEDKKVVFLTATAIEGPWNANVFSDEDGPFSAVSVASDGEDWMAVGEKETGGNPYTPNPRVWNPETTGAGWGLTL